jgi:hypothetical protein
MFRILLAASFFVAAPLAAYSASSVLLYGESFDSVSTPTFEVTFGRPEIASATSPFPTQSLEFNTQGNPGRFFYDQIQFRVDYVRSPYLGIAHTRFHVSFDVLTQGLVGTPNHFVALLDIPGASALRFNGNGDVIVQNLGAGVHSRFADQQRIHVDMGLDLTTQHLSIALDGRQIYSAGTRAEKLQSVRFSLGAQSADVVDHAPTVFVDNINISAVVPEPSSAVVAATATFGCSVVCTRRSLKPATSRCPKWDRLADQPERPMSRGRLIAIGGASCTCQCSVRIR